MSATEQVHSWSTSCFGQPADTSPAELAALGEHLGQCKRSRSRLNALMGEAEGVQQFFAVRMLTTLVLIALLAVVVGAVCLNV